MSWFVLLDLCTELRPALERYMAGSQGLSVPTQVLTTLRAHSLFKYICVCMLGRIMVIQRLLSIPHWSESSNKSYLDSCVRTHIWFFMPVFGFLRTLVLQWNLRKSLYIPGDRDRTKTGKCLPNIDITVVVISYIIYYIYSIINLCESSPTQLHACVVFSSLTQ